MQLGTAVTFLSIFLRSGFAGAARSPYSRHGPCLAQARCDWQLTFPQQAVTAPQRRVDVERVLHRHDGMEPLSEDPKYRDPMIVMSKRFKWKPAKRI